MSNKRSAMLVAMAAVGSAAAFLAVRAVQRSRGPDEETDAAATYPPRNTLKPIGENIWIVDSGPIRPGGVALPIRMTILRLRSGDLLLHSPTEISESLVDEVRALGPVRHLVAPNIAHWTLLGEWQTRFPEALTWAAPGLRDRAQVRASGLRLDRDLGERAPPEWDGEVDQGLIRGTAFSEVYFFHRESRTLILTDVVQHMPSDRLPAWTRAFVLLSGAHAGTTPRYLRAILRLHRREAASAFDEMLGLAPERVIFAHGEWFERDGTNRLRQALSWLV
jgi:hypothetical protein